MGKMDHVQIPQATSGRRTSVTDTRGRVLGDLRISVTDRCNLRCRYCMPKELFGEAFKFMPRSELLTFEEIARIARCVVGLGVTKIRLTGGEPLVRRNLEDLVAAIADIGGTDIALTTNGVLLTDEKARALKAAGLHRITVSLDALEPDVFQYMSGSTVELARILAAINAASAAGLNPVKVNMVVQRGVNEKSILPMAEHFRGTGHILRFIEFMDVGTSNRWQMKDVVTADEIRQLIDDKWPLERVPRRHLGEVAQRYRYPDGGGDIGLIGTPSCGQALTTRRPNGRKCGKSEGEPSPQRLCQQQQNGTGERSVSAAPRVLADRLVPVHAIGAPGRAAVLVPVAALPGGDQEPANRRLSCRSQARRCRGTAAFSEGFMAVCLGPHRAAAVSAMARASAARGATGCARRR